MLFKRSAVPSDVSLLTTTMFINYHKDKNCCKLQSAKILGEGGAGV